MYETVALMLSYYDKGTVLAPNERMFVEFLTAVQTSNQKVITLRP